MHKTLAFILVLASLMACSTPDDAVSHSDAMLPAFPEALLQEDTLTTAATFSDMNAIVNGTHKMRWAYFTDNDPNGSSSHSFGRYNFWYISKLTSPSTVYSLTPIVNGVAGWGVVGENAANIFEMPVEPNQGNIKVSIDNWVANETSTTYYDAGLGRQVTHPRIVDHRRKIAGQTVNVAWYFFKVEETNSWYIINLPDFGTSTRVFKFAAAVDANGVWQYNWQRVPGIEEDKWVANFSWNNGLTLGFIEQPQPGDDPDPGDGGDEPTTYTLLTSVAGLGHVRSDSGILCGEGIVENRACGIEVEAGTTVYLERKANVAGVDGIWEGVCSGSGDICAVTVNQHQVVRIRFTGEQYPITYTLALNVGENGSVSFNGQQCDGGLCVYNVTEGDNITVYASPDAGYSVFWGCPEPGPNSCTVRNVRTNRQINAKFVRDQITPSRHTLLVDVRENGGVSVNGERCTVGTSGVCVYSVIEGEDITIQALPDDNYRANWRCPEVNGNSCTVRNMSGQETVYVTFEYDPPSTHTLSTRVVGTGILRSDNGINCGNVHRDVRVCEIEVNPGTIVNLNRISMTIGSSHTWEGDCSGSAATCTITMDSDKDVILRFGTDQTSPSTYTLSVNAGNNGSVTFNGQRCSGRTCQDTVTQGDSVTLQASPNSGYSVNWSGCTRTSGNTCTVSNISRNQTVSANFTRDTLPKYTLSVSVSGDGRVTSSPAGIDCRDGAGRCSFQFDEGMSVRLTRTMSSGNTFSGWGSSCSGTNSTCNVTMSRSQNVTANFETTNSGSNFSIEISGEQDGTTCESNGSACSLSRGEMLSALSAGEAFASIELVGNTNVTLSLTGAVSFFDLSTTTLTTSSRSAFLKLTGGPPIGEHRVVITARAANGQSKSVTYTLRVPGL